MGVSRELKVVQAMVKIIEPTMMMETRTCFMGLILCFLSTVLYISWLADALGRLFEDSGNIRNQNKTRISALPFILFYWRKGNSLSFDFQGSLGIGELIYDLPISEMDHIYSSSHFSLPLVAFFK